MKEADVSIGNRIRAFRHAKKLTQSELGEQLGVTFQQIQKYENGRNRLSGSRLTTLCNVLGITPNQLLGYGKVNGAGVSFTALADSRMADIVQAIGNMPAAKRRPAIEVIWSVLRYLEAK